MPFRVWFFVGSSIAWFDDDGDGNRSSAMANILGLWPDVAFLATPGRPDGPCVELAIPVTPTVLCLARDTPRGPERAYVDIVRNVEVPPPAGPERTLFFRQAISSGPGPELIRIDAEDNAHTIDMRTGIRGPKTRWTLTDPRFPVLLIPGEPARFISKLGDTDTVMTLGSPDGQSLSAAFFLPTSRIDTVTLTYGDLSRPAMADMTGSFGDADMNPFRRLIGEFLDGAHILAALFLLTGLDPQAWHPDGRFGLAHMTAEQLAAGGWDDSPELIIRAGSGAQAETLVSFLETLPFGEHDGPERLLTLLGAEPDDVPGLVARVEALCAGPFGREVNARFSHASFLA